LNAWLDSHTNSQLRKWCGLIEACGLFCLLSTGKTPQRQEFEYPRILFKTAPHSKIIEEFRKGYIEQEAIHTQLPCDSDEEKVNSYA